MKTILIPTDLSPESENAFTYAIEFAMSVPEKIQLILLHVFETSVINMDTTAALMLSDLEMMEQATRETMEQMAESFLRATGLNCNIVTSRGFLDVEIASAAALYKADYIFMGTTGGKGLLASLLGSNTSQVIKNAPCPVLAIPDKAIFSPIRKIVFASNFGDNDGADFRKIVKFAELYHSVIVLLHISEKAEENTDMQVLEFVRAQMKSNTGYPRIEIATAHAGNFVQGLEKELHNHNASLLVMAPRKHGFVDNILGKSRTKQMVLHTKIPLLALPVTENVKEETSEEVKILKSI